MSEHKSLNTSVTSLVTDAVQSAGGGRRGVTTLIFNFQYLFDFKTPLNTMERLKGQTIKPVNFVEH